MRPLILTLDAASQPLHWVTWEDAIVAKCKGNIACEIGDEDFLFKGGVSRMTGLQSEVTVGSIIILKDIPKFRHKDASLTNRNLFRRDLHICAYCGNRFHEDLLTRDHIIPTSRGGKDIWTNVVTACKGCNNYKDDMFLHECNMELLYVPYTPNRAEALILQNRKILADQKEFLCQFVPKHSRLLNA